VSLSHIIHKRETDDQQRFTVSEAADYWRELMLFGSIFQPSVATLTDNWIGVAANRHTVAPISHTRPSPRKLLYSIPVPLEVGR